MSPDARRHSPAAERNADALLAALGPRLPATGTVLEIASGSGQHAVHFARALSGLRWQPSDPDPEARRSIRAWSQGQDLDNVAAPLALDVHQHPWPVERADAVFCANLLHVAPPQAIADLAEGAARVLAPGGPLLVYGPLRVDGVHTAASNARFDRSLRERNPDWGVRDTRELASAAAAAGLAWCESVAMPANNLLLVFRRRESAAQGISR